jgi:hypothetical protein
MDAMRLWWLVGEGGRDADGSLMQARRVHWRSQVQSRGFTIQARCDAHPQPAVDADLLDGIR